MKKLTLHASVLLAILAAGQVATAAVSPDEAAQLKTTLTPLGGEKAGNKAGTIPAWQGGFAGTIPGYKPGSGKYPDPFAEEKPLLQITPQNVSQHAEMLPDGAAEMLRRIPSFRIDVYPTHRTASAPQAVYDATFRNATSAKLTESGPSIVGAWGGTPFPIPKSGAEAIWNHVLHARPAAYELNFSNFIGTSNGKKTLASAGEVVNQVPYFMKDTAEQKQNGAYLYSRAKTTAPSFKAGESLLLHDSLDFDNNRQAWQYLVGQRRVRKAPTVGYDTPDFVASGSNYFDEITGFFGALDRFDWKLAGKKELYVPYNNNRFFAADPDQALAAYHINPDKLRWELHRVWVVDATVKPGKRHAVAKRRYYLDEDTWTILAVDGFDAEGKLWRFQHNLSLVAPDMNMLFMDPSVVYNLQAKTYSMIQFIESIKPVAPRSPSYFSPDSLASDSAR
ncbi:DUF1329 domain-containing protein [Janthinobacterium sp. HLX7-2]|uniref:DUF1329 domain-containing protein n=1 Tax=Janthinobacterium sp. HLX7-2 TaxID=1259331 RepID=UPI003F1FCDE6